MSTIQVKCTYCSETLEAENTLRAYVCPHCGRPFLIEEAARFYEHPDFMVTGGELVKYTGTQAEETVHR